MRSGDDTDAGAVIGGRAVAGAIIAGSDAGLKERKRDEGEQEREKLLHN